MRFPKACLIAVPLAALAVSGCGGGGDDSSAATPAKTETTSTISKADLISKGDAVCAEVNAAVGSVGNSESEVASQVIQVSDLYIGMVDSIKGLGRPEEGAGYAELIAAGEALSKAEGEAKLAAERGDTTALGAAASKAGPALEEFESLAGAYGFENCSEGPSAPTTGAGAPGETEEGGVEVAPEEGEVEEVPEEAPAETGGAGGTGTGEEGGGETGENSGGIGPG